MLAFESYRSPEALKRLLKELIEAGDNPHARDDTGRNVFHYAAQKDIREGLQFLIDNALKTEPFGIFSGVEMNWNYHG